MRAHWMERMVVAAATLIACAGLAMTAGSAAAQMSGDLRYTRGYDLMPNPPVASQATTFVLYGVYPTGCGVVESKSVIDAEHVALQVRSFASCPDSSMGAWAESFSLGMLAAGTHTLIGSLGHALSCGRRMAGLWCWTGPASHPTFLIVDLRRAQPSSAGTVAGPRVGATASWCHTQPRGIGA